MTIRVRRIWWLAAIVVLALLGLLLLAFGDPQVLGNPIDERAIIVFYGTFFGQTSIAAAWCALGPFSLARRLAVSSVWLAMSVVAFGINDPAPPFPDIDSILTYGAMALGQWALSAGPMWFVAAWLGLRFVPDAAPRVNEESRNRQIGIREAMILTAVVAGVLGAASLRSGALRGISINWRIAGELGFVTVASAIMTFAPLVGMLLGRKWLLSISGALVLVAVSIAVELAAVQLAWPGPRGVLLVFGLMAAVQSAWIIMALSLLRLSGYELTLRRTRLDT